MATKKEKKAWLNERDKRESMKSLFYFGKFVLGYELEYTPHKEVCDFVQAVIEKHKKGLILVPRGTYKTTIVSQILPLWLIMKNPNVRILLDSQVLRNSERNLGVIKGMIEHNERFRELFGDFKDKDRWTQSEVTVSKRSNYSLKEPTVGTSSVDTVEVGPHWDYIIPDDLHNEKNTRNRDQIDLVYEHWRLLFSLLEPGGAMPMVGTRWADLDVYGRIIEDHKDFKVMCRGAVLEDGSFFFPTRFPQEVLDDIKRQQGIDMFSAQYMNDPMPQGATAAFRKEWFRYGRDLTAKYFILVDPAISVRKGADYTAIILAGINSDNDIYVEKAVYGHFHPWEMIDKIFEMYDDYSAQVSIKGIGIEVNAFQKLLKFSLEEAMKKRGKFVKIHELRHSKAKSERVLSLQPRYQGGAMFHNPGLRGGEIEEELLKFPRGRRDDCIDALASLLEIVGPRKIKPKEIKRGVTEDGMNIDKLMKLSKEHKRRGTRTVHPSLGSEW